MVQNLLLNKDCWLAHMSLNQTTGLDPAGIKVSLVTDQLTDQLTD